MRPESPGALFVLFFFFFFVAKNDTGAFDRIPKRFRGVVVTKKAIARLGGSRSRIVSVKYFPESHAAGMRGPGLAPYRKTDIAISPLVEPRVSA